MQVLTLARDLKRRKARARRDLFVAEGVRAVEELVRSALSVTGVLLSETAKTAPRIAPLRDALASRGATIDLVSDADFRSAADTDNPQGILALAAVPSWNIASLDATDPWRLLVLDGVQDPGNVGTLIRTAAALGALATLALPGTVDLWNAKVVRSAVGAHFRHPAFSCTWDALGEFLQRREAVLWAADGMGTPVDARRAPRRLALAVGNEGAGTSARVASLAARRVAVPMAPGVESLNVAVAAGILLYALMP